jgi:hypothetical protein
MFAGAYFVIRSVSLRALSTASFVSQSISSAFATWEIGISTARQSLYGHGDRLNAIA